MRSNSLTAVEDPVHLHWCPRCEATWACRHEFATCPLHGHVVSADHCDAPEPDDLD
jgi:hypothetical protein